MKHFPLLFFLIVSQFSQAQWIESWTNIATNADIRYLEFAGNRIFA